MPKKDYYRILGIAPLCSGEDIHKNYRALAKKYHPDICKEKILAEEKMKELSEAYETLKDFAKRTAYDKNRLFVFREYKDALKKAGQKKKEGFFDKLFKKKEQKSKWKSDKPFREKNPIEFSFSMGVTYSHNRKPDSIDCAKQEFKKIIQLDPKMSDAYYNLGLCHYLLGEFEDALMAFKRASTIYPKDIDAKSMAEMLYEKFN